jgi:hypothetical protein
MNSSHLVYLGSSCLMTLPLQLGVIFRRLSLSSVQVSLLHRMPLATILADSEQSACVVSSEYTVCTHQQCSDRVSELHPLSWAWKRLPDSCYSPVSFVPFHQGIFPFAVL